MSKSLPIKISKNKRNLLFIHQKRRPVMIEVPHNCWTKDPMIVRYFFYVKIFFRIKITDC